MNLLICLCHFFGGGKDSFVLCRIFQKRASGPQNGAQYGAPFIEEEWEETEDMLVKAEEWEETEDMVVTTEGIPVVVPYASHAAEQDYVQYDDSDKVNILAPSHFIRMLFLVPVKKR